MRYFAYTWILITSILCSCHNVQSELNKEQSSESPQKGDVIDRDTQLIAYLQRRKDLEKKGFNYSAKIISDSKIMYSGKQLTYIQDLPDSTNIIRGKVYVELLNDSVFKSLYVINNNDPVYYVGDGILANRIDTTKYSLTNTFGFKFILRYKNYIVIECVDKTGNGVSDSWTIQYLDQNGIFDNPDKI